jgi:hypothetical protein
MCVCMFLCCVVLCFGRGFSLDWSPNQWVLPNICGSRSPLRKAKSDKDCRSQLKKNKNYIIRQEPHCFKYFDITMYLFYDNFEDTSNHRKYVLWVCSLQGVYWKILLLMSTVYWRLCKGSAI